MENSLQILGIDPGASQSAFVLWTGKKILDKSICPNEELLDILIGDYLDVASIAEDIVLAIESMVHITMGGKSIVDTLLWAGRFYQAWQGEKEFVPVHVVRKALGAKNDKWIRIALIQRFGLPGTKQKPGLLYGLGGKGYHLWRAFSVAVAHMDHLEFQGREMK